MCPVLLLVLCLLCFSSLSFGLSFADPSLFIWIVTLRNLFKPDYWVESKRAEAVGRTESSVWVALTSAHVGTRTLKRRWTISDAKELLGGNLSLPIFIRTEDMHGAETGRKPDSASHRANSERLAILCAHVLCRSMWFHHSTSSLCSMSRGQRLQHKICHIIRIYTPWGKSKRVKRHGLCERAMNFWKVT